MSLSQSWLEPLNLGSVVNNSTIAFALLAFFITDLETISGSYYFFYCC